MCLYRNRFYTHKHTCITVNPLREFVPWIGLLRGKRVLNTSVKQTDCLLSGVKTFWWLHLLASYLLGNHIPIYTYYLFIMHKCIHKWIHLWALLIIQSFLSVNTFKVAENNCNKWLVLIHCSLFHNQHDNWETVIKKFEFRPFIMLSLRNKLAAILMALVADVFYPGHFLPSAPHWY